MGSPIYEREATLAVEGMPERLHYAVMVKRYGKALPETVSYHRRWKAAIRALATVCANRPKATPSYSAYGKRLYSDAHAAFIRTPGGKLYSLLEARKVGV